MEILRIGSTGPIVELLQSTLQKIGFYSGTIDGSFGLNTKNAVIRFQREFGLISDGIVGRNTWDKLYPYTNWNTVSYSYSILDLNLQILKRIYPFIEIGYIGTSILGKRIPYLKIGTGTKEVFYNASFHANEWINTPLLMKFVENYAKAYVNDTIIYGIRARQIYNETSIYIAPMVNPDGVNLVTGEIKVGSTVYNNVKTISDKYPQIPFPQGWKANIRGVDLNLQYPAGWQEARRIKYEQGFTRTST